MTVCETLCSTRRVRTTFIGRPPTLLSSGTCSVTHSDSVWIGACGTRPFGAGRPKIPATRVVQPRRKKSCGTEVSGAARGRAGRWTDPVEAGGSLNWEATRLSHDGRNLGTKSVSDGEGRRNSSAYVVVKVEEERNEAAEREGDEDPLDVEVPEVDNPVPTAREELSAQSREVFRQVETNSVEGANAFVMGRNSRAVSLRFPGLRKEVSGGEECHAWKGTHMCTNPVKKTIASANE